VTGPGALYAGAFLGCLALGCDAHAVPDPRTAAELMAGVAGTVHYTPPGGMLPRAHHVTSPFSTHAALPIWPDRLLQPLYRPFRRIIPPTNGIDWSPLLLLVTIGILRIILGNVAYSVG